MASPTPSAHSDGSTAIERMASSRNSTIVNHRRELANGEKRQTPFQRFRERKGLGLDDDDLFHSFVDYDRYLASRGALVITSTSARGVLLLFSVIVCMSCRRKKIS